MYQNASHMHNNIRTQTFSPKKSMQRQQYETMTRGNLPEHAIANIAIDVPSTLLTRSSYPHACTEHGKRAWNNRMRRCAYDCFSVESFRTPNDNESKRRKIGYCKTCNTHMKRFFFFNLCILYIEHFMVVLCSNWWEYMTWASYVCFVFASRVERGNIIRCVQNVIHLLIELKNAYWICLMIRHFYTFHLLFMNVNEFMP